MVFKRNVVEDRLAFLRETLEELQRHQEIPKPEFLTNRTKRWAVEHGLHLAAEAVFDIGNHILVGHFRARAVGYDRVLTELENRRVISPELVARFEKLGGFRNILIHEYLDVDPDTVYDRLQNGLGDFEQFQREIVKWLSHLES